VPNPTNGIATSHVEFSLGSVMANLFTVPNTSAGSGVGGSGFGGGFGGSGLGGIIGGFFGSPGPPGTPGTPGTPSGSGILGIGSLNPGDLLALLFMIQGFSTAAVAAAASNAETMARLSQPVIGEETQ
jgi:hypothetical protein